MVDPKRGWIRIRKSADLADVRIHDLRRTMGSYMASMGSPLIPLGVEPLVEVRQRSIFHLFKLNTMRPTVFRAG